MSSDSAGTINCVDPSTSSSPARPLTLGYSTLGAPASLRIRALILLLVAANLYFVYGKWGHQWVDPLRMLYVQRACANFEWPDGQVVFEGYPDRAKKLLQTGEYDDLSTAGRSFAAVTSAVKLNDSYDQAKARMYSGGVFGGRGGGWLFGGGGGGASVGRQELVVFLHERRTPLGNVRIVMLSGTISLPDQTISLAAGVTQPGTYSESPQDLPQARSKELPDDIDIKPCAYEDVPSLRIFGGHPDRNDPTRFTVDYEDFYGRSTIEGRLDDDDIVHLRTIIGPSARWKQPE